MITKLSFLASILLLISLGFASQDIDIPDREYGFTIGDRSGNLHIEFVMDLLCKSNSNVRYRFKIKVCFVERCIKTIQYL